MYIDELTYNREKPTIDARNTLCADDGDGSVHKPAVLWVRPVGVVDEFRSV